MENGGEEGGYGESDDNDMWKIIQKTDVEDGYAKKYDLKTWFVPSKSEWAAFGGELEITKDNYSGYKLNSWYWSSSRSNCAYYATFDHGYMGRDNVNYANFVRLSATF